MSLLKTALPLAALALATVPATAQHQQTSCVAVRPTDLAEVWTCNRDNSSVAVVDTAAIQTVATVSTGNWPRSLAFTPDGNKVFVACQRGNVALTKTFVTPFDGSERRGQVMVIDANTRTVIHTIDEPGIEPYGLAVSPNGLWFAVTGMRSGTVKFYSTQSHAPLASFQYLSNLNDIPNPFTIADADANRDGMADLGEPRGFVIRADGARLYVTHFRSPYVSVLDLAIDGFGQPTGATLAAKIDTNEYPFDPFYNPVSVQTIESQGLPRFLEDVALSPDGTRALVPHVLHNINHDVNFDFGPSFPGAFANRVYPALTTIDAVTNTYGQLGDNSNRLHHELSDPANPAEFVSFGVPTPNVGGRAVLGASGAPVLGGSATFIVDGLQPGQVAQIWIGRPINIPQGQLGTKLATQRYTLPVPPSGMVTFPIPSSTSLLSVVAVAQAVFFNQSSGLIERYSNGLKIVFGSQSFGVDNLGYRAGQPSRVQYNPAGDMAVMMNRGSEDVFLYRVNGSQMTLAGTFPPRFQFAPRAPLDTSTATGDFPLGICISDDPGTSNDDARIYVMNETTRTLSTLRVDWKSGVMFQELPQIPTLLSADVFTLSQRRGEEIFEDSSRPQTAGNFNNSCTSCHFEGGEDGNVWQRGVGPRTTMPVYGGTLLTGLVLWKGIRLNLGETGPMFGGENGGTGVFTDAEQQGLVDFHESIPVPLNPNFDSVTHQYTTLAAVGRDLFFGTNDSLTNPSLRHAGCASCHPDFDTVSSSVRGYTSDFIDPQLSMGENLETFDPFCSMLQENMIGLNIRNVNSGCNIDADGDTIPDLDRNADGYVDLETYAIMNLDDKSDFTRDDANSYLCPQDPQDPFGPLKVFIRSVSLFTVPTKLGVFSSGPYFHDHSAYSLRTLLDPEAQALSTKYGSPAFPSQPAYPGLNKLFNEFHDVRGHEQFVQGASKVQLNLLSNVNNTHDADIEALLAYIQSL